MNYLQVYPTNYLSHHGVKGMKWGVRRTPEQLGKKIEKLYSKRSKLRTHLDTTRSDRMKKFRNLQSRSEMYEARQKMHYGKAGGLAGHTIPGYAAYHMMIHYSDLKKSGKYKNAAQTILNNISKEELRISRLDNKISKLGEKQIKMLSGGN